MYHVLQKKEFTSITTFTMTQPGVLSMVSYLLQDLIFFPYLKKTHGMGNSKTAMKPNKLEAHPVPSLVYTITV